MGGVASVSSPGGGWFGGSELEFGWFVHGFLSTVAGFFSSAGSGRGIGGGSGGVTEGCTVGASGMSFAWSGWVVGGWACWVWLAADCAAIFPTARQRYPPKHPATRTAAIHPATTVRGLL